MAITKKSAASKVTKNLPPKKTAKGGYIIDGGKTQFPPPEPDKVAGILYPRLHY